MSSQHSTLGTSSNDEDESMKSNDEVVVCLVVEPQSPTPLPSVLEDAWKSDKIVRYQDEGGKKKWRCLHCNTDPFKDWNHTKVMAHLCSIKGFNVRPCSSVIPQGYMKRYVDLWNTKTRKKADKRKREALINVSLEETETSALAYYKAAKMKKHRLGPQGPGCMDTLVLTTAGTIATESIR